MTPTVPPMTASAPEPKVTSASSRRISFLYRRDRAWGPGQRLDVERQLLAQVVQGDRTAGRAARWRSCRAPSLAPHLAMLSHQDPFAGTTWKYSAVMHEVDEEQQHERDDHRLVDRVAHALRSAAGVEALVARRPPRR